MNTQRSSFHILRVGMAITFLWIGILIFKEPGAWGSYLQPWALNLLPVPLEQAMISTAVLDIAIGALLLFEIWMSWAVLLGSIHLILVLAVSGINEATVRDIAILAGTLALFADTISKRTLDNILFWKNKN